MIHIFRRHKNTWHFNVSRCLGRLYLHMSCCYLIPRPAVSYCATKYLTLVCARKKRARTKLQLTSRRKYNWIPGIIRKNILHNSKKRGKTMSESLKQKEIPNINLCVRLSLPYSFCCLRAPGSSLLNFHDVHFHTQLGLWWMMLSLIRSHFSHWLIVPRKVFTVSIDFGAEAKRKRR